MSYRPFSRDIWDYLGDMPYMPSRADRDALLASEDPRRVQIWDYFFRIDSQDVGGPQKAEIQTIREELQQELEKYQAEVSRLQGDIENQRASAGMRIRRSLLLSVGGLLLGSLLAAALLYTQAFQKLALVCGAPLWLIGIIALVILVRAFLGERSARKALEAQIQDLHDLNKSKVKAVRNRVGALERVIYTLIQQIPPPPKDEQVRAWLDGHLARLHQHSIEQTRLGDRLEPVGQQGDGRPALLDNPLPVMGPGELQDEIPQTFSKEINRDLNKHLMARRAYTASDGPIVDVLYGVYYIQYIAVTQDMLATYGFFYDFITGKLSSERITEQYYRDVIAITTTNESRQVMLGVDSDEYIFVEDAPTFTLSLSNNENRQVTFVNHNYFHGIRDKLGLSEDEVRRIYWVHDAEKTAENAVQSLRYYLREHKGDEGRWTTDHGPWTTGEGRETRNEDR